MKSSYCNLHFAEGRQGEDKEGMRRGGAEFFFFQWDYHLSIKNERGTTEIMLFLVHLVLIFHFTVYWHICAAWALSLAIKNILFLSAWICGGERHDSYYVI